jgi:hypothetical protein
LTPTLSAERQAAWQAAAESTLAAHTPPAAAAATLGPAQYLVLIDCRDEKHQVELLTRFQAEGLECRALLS